MRLLSDLLLAAVLGLGLGIWVGEHYQLKSDGGAITAAQVVQLTKGDKQ